MAILGSLGGVFNLVMFNSGKRPFPSQETGEKLTSKCIDTTIFLFYTVRKIDKLSTSTPFLA